MALDIDHEAQELLSAETRLGLGYTTPAQRLIEYELRHFGHHAGDPSPYLGEPSAELDVAWDDLYPSLYQLIPQVQAAQLHNSTIIFSHNPECRYMVDLDVFHQLHCLVDTPPLPHNLNPIQSRPNTLPHRAWSAKAPTRNTTKPWHPIWSTASQKIFSLEEIRQALVCHVDVTPYTWVWNDETQMMNNVFATPHTCRNFDTARNWTRPENYAGSVEPDS
ncbi:hypothetical protein BDV12DRAFT_196294 [Aspergillus spectabilis]